MIVIIDNYDSFVYNIVHFLNLPENELRVVRNDKFCLKDLEDDQVDGIIISPGPMTPYEAGLSCDVIREYYCKKPILGICLGFECIGTVFGSDIIQCENIVHGESDTVYLQPSPLYKGIPNPMVAARYHSLKIDEATFCHEELVINARLKDGMIMGLEHKNAPLYGVLFHPESILTGENGKKLLHNFVEICQEFSENRRMRNCNE